MQTDVLIIGQGICGTHLGYWLEKAGLSYFVVDEPVPNSASRVAAGVINPVTGRRIVKTWMIDELMPFARDAYEQLGAELGLSLISQKNVLDFFPTPQMRRAYEQRYETDQQYLRPVSDEQIWRSFLQYDFGFGEIDPCYFIDLGSLLAAWRTRLRNRHRLLEEQLIYPDLVIEQNQVSYRDIRAGSIVFCDGIGSGNNPWFRNLPFAPNKGEALIIEVDGLPSTHIFKKGINMIPLGEGRFWVGSSYEWEFGDDQPSDLFRQRTESWLKDWLQLPFRVVDHVASIRPATLERRPFVGFHPGYSSIGILNGMGTKGCSLAPFFAKQLTEQMLGKSPVLPEADVKRFSRLLNRS
ncbi:MAG TPA: FAD-binding oxidoreductase [Puia sp.]|nr:FAD-binding oxidoreductase [Puia sp.]